MYDNIHESQMIEFVLEKAETVENIEGLCVYEASFLGSFNLRTVWLTLYCTILTFNDFEKESF